MLDAKDRRILSELQKDSRLPMKELGERTGMSSSACWRRVKSLEETGIIDRYAVIANTRKAGFEFSSVVHVSLARHEQKNVDRFIKEAELEDRIATREIVIPGLLAQISGELEAALPGWSVLVGPQEAADIESFIKARLNG